MSHRELVIRNKIEALDGAGFQMLAQELITASHHLTKPSHLGTASGSAKTAPGTPDTFWTLPGNRFAFLECGHYPKRTAAINKIKEDINACINAEKLLSQGHLDKIIIAYTCRRLAPSDIADLNAIDDRVELIGIDEMAAMLSHDYAYLASDHLNIPCSTGQILSIEAFEKKVSRSPFSAPLNTTLQKRADDLSALFDMITHSKVTIIEGRPGLGKTRLSLDALRLYQKTYEATAVVIKSNGQPIWNDLNIDLPHDEPCIVLLDDANELSELESIVDYVQDRNNLTILATVRNYAKQYVVDKIKSISTLRVMSLAPLSIENVEAVIASCFGMENEQLAQEIAEASKGNLRIAHAIASALKSTGDPETRDIASLVQESYGEAIRSFSREELLTGTICSILGAHQTSDNADLSALETHYGISHLDYLSSLKTLHEKELLDVCQDYVAVDCGDQVLRDYLIYKTLYVDTSIDLATIRALTCGKERMLLCVEIAISSFYSEGIYKLIQQQLAAIWDKANREDRWDMVPTYNHLLGDKAYREISLRIDDLKSSRITYTEDTIALQRKSHEVKSVILRAICPFLHQGPFDTPEELVFKYLSKTNLPPNDIAVVICEKMGYNMHSHLNLFRYELDVLERLYEKWEISNDPTYAVLCCEYARHLLQPGYESISYGNNDQVRLIRAYYSPSDSLLSVRKRSLTILKKLRGQKQIGDLPDRIVAQIPAAGYGQDSEQLLIETLSDINQTYMREVPSTTPKLAPMFSRLEATMKQYEIDTTESFAFLHSNKLIDVYSELAAESLCGNDEKIELLADSVSSLTNEEFYDLLTVIDENAADTKGVPSWNLKSILDTMSPQKIKRLCGNTLYLLNAPLPAICITNSMITIWLEETNLEKLRQTILSSSNPNKQDWLSRIYNHQMIANPTPEVFGYIQDEQIWIPFALVCKGEKIQPGFFSAYLNQMRIRSKQNPSALQYVFPDSKEVQEHYSTLTDSHVFKSLREALLFAVSDNHLYIFPEFMKFVIEQDALFGGADEKLDSLESGLEFACTMQRKRRMRWTCGSRSRVRCRSRASSPSLAIRRTIV